MMVRWPKRALPGSILTPGASAGRDQSGLVAIDEAVTRTGVTVERVEFPGQAAGKRRTDPPAVCIETVRTATDALAERLSVPTGRIAIGGRSFGGRMCSLAAAEGLARGGAGPGQLSAAPAGPPRTPAHRALSRAATCPVSSSRADAMPSPAPEELERETAAIPGPVTRHFVDGDHSLRKSEAEVGRHRRRLDAPGSPAGRDRPGARRLRPRVRCGRSASRSRCAMRVSSVGVEPARPDSAPGSARPRRGRGRRHTSPALRRSGRCRRGSPACTIVASSTAGRVSGSTRPIGLIASADGTKMVMSPRSSREEVVGDHGARRAGRRHALRGQRGGELPERALEPRAQFVEAHRLADGGGLQCRFAAVLHGQSPATGPAATRVARPPPPGSGAVPAPAGPGDRR